jgi:hypothetical protein
VVNLASDLVDELDQLVVIKNLKDLLYVLVSIKLMTKRGE